MGLDNGFYVKSDKRELTRADLPSAITYPFESDYGGNIEIVYWRKCWGLRNEVINTFGWYNAPPEQYIFTIDKPEQVYTLIKIISSWNEEKWEDRADSIWTFDEMRDVLIQNIVNFAIIYEFMRENPDIYLEFYDSY